MSERSREDELLIADLSMLVAKLVRRLQRQQDQSGLAEAARDFLTRKGLNGSVLRLTNDEIANKLSDEDHAASR